MRFSISKLVRGISFAAGLLVAHQMLLAAKPASATQEKPSEPRRSVMQRYMELSRTVNAEPKIADLRSKAEEARKNYQKAFEAAMQKEDPKILEQFKGMRGNTLSRLGDQRLHKGAEINQPASNSYDRFDEAEKKQLDAARRAAMLSNSVKEARQRRNEAKDEDARVKAVTAYREALHKAMIEADEGVENLLKKLEEAK